MEQWLSSTEMLLPYTLLLLKVAKNKNKNKNDVSKILNRTNIVLTLNSQILVE